MDILCPDLDSVSDSDKDDNLFGTEWLDTATDHIVLNVQVMKSFNYSTQNLCQHFLRLEQCAHAYWPNI